jgi:nicotinamide phosphoribosyltransferase
MFANVIDLFIVGEPLEVIPRLLTILYEKFGGYVNEKGFKVLDKHVRLIQGDGVNLQSIKEITSTIQKLGFSNDNIAFGSGGRFISSCNARFIVLF